MGENKYQSEIVTDFDDIYKQLLEVLPARDPNARALIAAILVLARELNFLRQDLEGRN